MSTDKELIRLLNIEIMNLKKDLEYERQRYIKLYNVSLEISKDYMKYAEKHPNHDIDDYDDPFNLIKMNYDDIISFNFD